MKKAFENILKAIYELNENKTKYIISQLKIITDKINYLTNQNDSFKYQLTGDIAKQYNDNLDKSISILNLFGFNEATFFSINPDFLNWMHNNSLGQKKYNPKLMNHTILIAMMQSYFLLCAENEGKEPTYKELRNYIINYENNLVESDNSLNSLIKKLHGEN